LKALLYLAIALDLRLYFFLGIVPCKLQEETFIIQTLDIDYFGQSIAVSCAADGDDFANMELPVVQKGRLHGSERVLGWTSISRDNFHILCPRILNHVE
jgi:hypothetical protein